MKHFSDVSIALPFSSWFLLLPEFQPTLSNQFVIFYWTTFESIKTMFVTTYRERIGSKYNIFTFFTMVHILLLVLTIKLTNSRTRRETHTLNKYINNGAFCIFAGLSFAEHPSLSRETMLSKLLDGSFGYILTYEDKDGDWMLVGDVPWR